MWRNSSLALFLALSLSALCFSPSAGGEETQASPMPTMQDVPTADSDGMITLSLTPEEYLALLRKDWEIEQLRMHVERLTDTLTNTESALQGERETTDLRIGQLQERAETAEASATYWQGEYDASEARLRRSERMRWWDRLLGGGVGGLIAWLLRGLVP